MLIAVAAQHPELLEEMLPERHLLGDTIGAGQTAISEALMQEQIAEKEADRIYWQPLKQELEQLRAAKHLKGRK